MTWMKEPVKNKTHKQMKGWKTEQKNKWKGGMNKWIKEWKTEQVKE